MGVPPKVGRSSGSIVGPKRNSAAEICVKCGVRLATAIPEDAKSKLVAALLGLFLGGVGVHRFYHRIHRHRDCADSRYADYIWRRGNPGGFIEGILILTGSMNKDAKGQPLRD